MPYKPGLRPELEQQLAALNPDFKLLEPEDPGFAQFLSEVTALDPKLASQIDKAVLDEQAEEARELFGKGAQQGGVLTVLNRTGERFKGNSVRGDKRVRPATLAALGGAGVLLLIGFTALMPEQKKTTTTTTTQTTPKVASPEDTTPLPTSTVDNVAEDVTTTTSTDSTTSTVEAAPLSPPDAATPSEPAPPPVTVDSTPSQTYSDPVYTSPAPSSYTSPSTYTPPTNTSVYETPENITSAPVRVTPAAPAPAPVPLSPTPTPVKKEPVAVSPVTPPPPVVLSQPPAATPPRSGLISSGQTGAAESQPRRGVVEAVPPETPPSVRRGIVTADDGATTQASVSGKRGVVTTEVPEAPRQGLVATEASSTTPPAAGLVMTSASDAQPAQRYGLVSQAQEQSSVAQGQGIVAQAGEAAPAGFVTAGGTDTAAGGFVSADAASRASAPAAPALPYTPGMQVQVKLDTGVAVYPGVTHPVWAKATDGSIWRGQASLDAATNRILLTFNTVMLQGQPRPVSAYAEAADGAGIGGHVRPSTPNAAQAAVNGLLGAVKSFVDSQAARTTTYTQSGLVTQSERPQNFWLALGGGLASSFTVPQTQAAVVQLGQMKSGETVTLRIDVGTSQ